MAKYGKKPLPVSERIKKSVVVDENGCWLWVGNLVHNGYGIFRYAGTRKRTVAHRASYIEFVGSIPSGLQLDHLCRVRHCVNPAHLEPVTPKENTKRSDSPAGINSRKTMCKHGHPLIGSNIFYRKDGSRRCRVCHNRLSLNSYYKSKSA